MRSYTRGVAKDWFRERVRLEEKWSAWRPTLMVRGVRLRAGLAFERSVPSVEKEFVIEFCDARGGSHDVDVKAKLARETFASMNRRVRASLRTLPIGECAQCGVKALLRNANLATSYLGEEPVELLSCERCVQRRITRTGKAEQALHRAKHRAGLLWVATAVFRRRADAREYFYREFFRTRPTKAPIRASARQHACAIVGGTTVIGRTRDYFIR